jgi:hypothetical protein
MPSRGDRTVFFDARFTIKTGILSHPPPDTQTTYNESSERLSTKNPAHRFPGFPGIII